MWPWQLAVARLGRSSARFFVERPVADRRHRPAAKRAGQTWHRDPPLYSRARGRAGVRELRAILDLGRIGDQVPRSELEQRFLALCRHGRLPRPAVNAWITVAGEEMQVDFVWHSQRVIVETDGYGTHGTRQAFQRDRRRDQLLVLAGWRVIRFTWDQATKEPERAIDVVRRLLSAAS